MTISTPSTPTTAAPVDPNRYVRPGGRGDRWANAVIRWLTAHGVSMRGSRVLTVAGRRTGQPRSHRP